MAKTSKRETERPAEELEKREAETEGTRKEQKAEKDEPVGTEDTEPTVTAEPEEQPEASAEGSSIEEELAQEREKYLRLAAEYDNFRKRSAKERETLYNDARAETVSRLLPVYDNLARALKAECEDKSFYTGVEMTMTQLREILENMGVMEIPAVGEVFDPNRHNAVMMIEDPELGEKIIAQEFEKGFMLGEKVIRFSTVVVAN